jgi:hypothetical protein
MDLHSAREFLVRKLAELSEEVQREEDCDGPIVGDFF